MIILNLSQTNRFAKQFLIKLHIQKTLQAILFIAGAMALFIILRSLNLWYWKIDENINNQKKIIELLEKLNDKKDITQ